MAKPSGDMAKASGNMPAPDETGLPARPALRRRSMALPGPAMTHVALDLALAMRVSIRPGPAMTHVALAWPWHRGTSHQRSREVEDSLACPPPELHAQTCGVAVDEALASALPSAFASNSATKGRHLGLVGRGMNRDVGLGWDVWSSSNSNHARLFSGCTGTLFACTIHRPQLLSLLVSSKLSVTLLQLLRTLSAIKGSSYLQMASSVGRIFWLVALLQAATCVSVNTLCSMRHTATSRAATDICCACPGGEAAVRRLCETLSH